MSKLCPKCGSTGDDLLFNFYCSNEDCENYHDDKKNNNDEQSLFNNAKKTIKTTDQILFDNAKKYLDFVKELEHQIGDMTVNEDINILVNSIISKDILLNQTYLVNHLLEIGEIASYDDIVNLYPDLYIISEEDLEELCENYTICYVDEDDDCREDMIDNLSCHLESQEIYEWWAVTEWLAKKLMSLGEPILESDYGTWWGRTCTGQAIQLDGTIQKIVE